MAIIAMVNAPIDSAKYIFAFNENSVVMEAAWNSSAAISTRATYTNTPAATELSTPVL